ncbi:MAG TPA: dephospho-CoA kinase [Acidobacteriaceae bacterium]
MLRVGLTGGLGSGKSTVGRFFSELGAFVVSADEIARKLMQPGEPVYIAIVREFGQDVLRADGTLDRKALAELAFEHNQADALNRLVHPATVAAEKEWMRGISQQHPSGVAIVESALIFEVEKWGTAPGWMECFDKLILVTVPDEVKIARFVARAMAASGGDASRREILERDARARLALQIPDAEKAPKCDYVIANTASLKETRSAVNQIYAELRQQAEGRVQGSGARDQGSSPG